MTQLSISFFEQNPTLFVVIGIILFIALYVVFDNFLQAGDAIFKSAITVIAIGLVLWAVVYSFKYFKEKHIVGHTGIITNSEIALENLQVTSVSDGVYFLRGRVKNYSADHTLTGITFNLTVQDCENETDDCDIVGSESSKNKLTVPPLQARDFEISFNFSDMIIRGVPRYGHVVTEIYAK